MSNFTNCDPTYSILWENLKYAAQAVYLVPAAVLCCRILYVIWAKESKFYSKHQFFTIYSLDCFVGLLLLLLDIFFTRLFVYIPQLCLSGSQFFLTHNYLLNVYYPLVNHLHCAQPLIQILLTTNRMTSVLFPIRHNEMWRQKHIHIVLFVSLTPFLFIWNTIISKKFISFYFGGFYVNYLKTVPWAGMSLFLMIIRSFAVAVTVITTSVTFWNMSKMKSRLKRSETVMCVACAINSICFLVPAAFEALNVFSTTWANSWMSSILQPFTWDMLNVGSPVVIICASNQLRHHVFSFSKEKLPNGSSSIALSLY